MLDPTKVCLYDPARLLMDLGICGVSYFFCAVLR